MSPSVHAACAIARYPLPYTRTQPCVRIDPDGRRSLVKRIRSALNRLTTAQKLKMNTKLAAHSMASKTNSSNFGRAGLKDGKSSESWESGGPGVLKTKEGVSSAAALLEFWRNMGDYKFECAAAVFLVRYMAILMTLQQIAFAECPSLGAADAMKRARAAFDALFPTLQIAANESTEIAQELVEGKPEAGDFGVVENPDPSRPGGNWDRENFILLELEDGEITNNTKVFAHPFGITTIGKIKKALDGQSLSRGRRPEPEVKEGHHSRVDASEVDTAADYEIRD